MPKLDDQTFSNTFKNDSVEFMRNILRDSSLDSEQNMNNLTKLPDRIGPKLITKLANIASPTQDCLDAIEEFYKSRDTVDPLFLSLEEIDDRSFRWRFGLKAYQLANIFRHSKPIKLASTILNVYYLRGLSSEDKKSIIDWLSLYPKSNILNSKDSLETLIGKLVNIKKECKLSSIEELIQSSPNLKNEIGPDFIEAVSQLITVQRIPFPKAVQLLMSCNCSAEKMRMLNSRLIDLHRKSRLLESKRSDFLEVLQNDTSEGNIFNVLTEFMDPLNKYMPLKDFGIVEVMELIANNKVKPADILSLRESMSNAKQTLKLIRCIQNHNNLHEKIKMFIRQQDKDQLNGTIQSIIVSTGSQLAVDTYIKLEEQGVFNLEHINSKFDKTYAVNFAENIMRSPNPEQDTELYIKLQKQGVLNSLSREILPDTPHLINSFNKLYQQNLLNDDIQRMAFISQKNSCDDHAGDKTIEQYIKIHEQGLQSIIKPMHNPGEKMKSFLKLHQAGIDVFNEQIRQVVNNFFSHWDCIYGTKTCIRLQELGILNDEASSLLLHAVGRFPNQILYEAMNQAQLNKFTEETKLNIFRVLVTCPEIYFDEKHKKQAIKDILETLNFEDIAQIDCELLQKSSYQQQHVSCLIKLKKLGMTVKDSQNLLLEIEKKYEKLKTNHLPQLLSVLNDTFTKVLDDVNNQFKKDQSNPIPTTQKIHKMTQLYVWLRDNIAATSSGLDEISYILANYHNIDLLNNKDQDTLLRYLYPQSHLILKSYISMERLGVLTQENMDQLCQLHKRALLSDSIYNVLFAPFGTIGAGHIQYDSDETKQVVFNFLIKVPYDQIIQSVAEKGLNKRFGEPADIKELNKIKRLQQVMTTEGVCNVTFTRALVDLLTNDELSQNQQEGLIRCLGQVGQAQLPTESYIDLLKNKQDLKTRADALKQLNKRHWDNDTQQQQAVEYIIHSLDPGSALNLVNEQTSAFEAFEKLRHHAQLKSQAMKDILDNYQASISSMWWTPQKYRNLKTEISNFYSTHNTFEELIASFESIIMAMATNRNKCRNKYGVTSTLNDFVNKLEATNELRSHEIKQQLGSIINQGRADENNLKFNNLTQHTDSDSKLSKLIHSKTLEQALRETKQNIEQTVIFKQDPYKDLIQAINQFNNAKDTHHLTQSHNFLNNIIQHMAKISSDTDTVQKGYTAMLQDFHNKLKDKSEDGNITPLITHLDAIQNKDQVGQKIEDQDLKFDITSKPKPELKEQPVNTRYTKGYQPDTEELEPGLNPRRSNISP